MVRSQVSNTNVKLITSSLTKVAGLGTSSVKSLKKQELVAGRWIIVKFCKTRLHVIFLKTIKALELK